MRCGLGGEAHGSPASLHLHCVKGRGAGGGPLEIWGWIKEKTRVHKPTGNSRQNEEEVGQKEEAEALPGWWGRVRGTSDPRNGQPSGKTLDRSQQSGGKCCICQAALFPADFIPFLPLREAASLQFPPRAGSTLLEIRNTQKSVQARGPADQPLFRP